MSLNSVGAIVVDSDYNFAVSLGGQSQGRLGQAAGCWVKDNVAVITPGIGEFLTLSVPARYFSEGIRKIMSKYAESMEEIEDDHFKEDMNDNISTRVIPNLEVKSMLLKDKLEC